MASVRPPQAAQRLVDAYITGLRQRLPTLCIRRLDQLPGATDPQLLRLRRAYPATPPELLHLLHRVNGTYWEAIRASPEVTTTTTTITSTSSNISKNNNNNNNNNNNIIGNGSGGGDSGLLSSSTSSVPVSPRPSATAAAASFVKMAFQGPDRRPIDKEKIAVPILGSALGTCPYFLATVEDILAPSRQPFPPKRKSAPRQPSAEDGAFLRGGGKGGNGPAATNNNNSSNNNNNNNNNNNDVDGSGGTAAVGAGATATTAEAQPPAVRSRVRPPGSSNIAAIYANLNIVRGPPPGAGGDGGAAASDRSASSVVADSSAKGLVAERTSSSDEAAFDPTKKSVYVDPRIDIHADFGTWLAFADSMLPHHQPWELEDNHDDDNADDNDEGKNAETSSPSPSPPRKASVSRLFVDFAPETMTGGVSGQIIQYSRGEPESFCVIAKDFGEYLKFLMSEEYAFTEELEDEDEKEVEQQRQQSGNGGNAKAAASTTLTSPSGQPIAPPSSSSSSSKKEEK